MAILDITNSTTVGNFNDTIQALEEAKKKTTKPAEQARFDELINKYTTSKNKLIKICKNDIIKGNMMSDAATRVEVGKLTRDNFKALSLQAWNKVLDAEHQHKENEFKDKDPGQAVIDFLDGKSGINLMTGVKATLTTAAIAALSSLNIAGFAEAMGLSIAGLPESVSVISIIPKAIGSLFALNPVIGVAAGALLGLGVIKLTKKIFGPEIKKLWANIKVRHAVNKQTEASQDKEFSEKDITEVLGGKSSEDYQKDAEDEIERTTKKNDGTYEREFSDKAFALATGDGVDIETKVNELKNEYKDKLDSDAIDRLLTSAGIAIKQPDLGDVATDLATDPKFRTRTGGRGTVPKSRTDFNDFKAAYQDLVVMIGKTSVANTEKAKAIRDLRTFANNPNKFLDKSGSTRGTSRSTPKDIERQEKIKKLCNGMVDIISELYAEVAKDVSKAATADTLKDALESARGLTADQIKNL